MDQSRKLKKYAKISYEKRLKFIDLVENQEFKIVSAARKVNIKLPTAKVILSQYRKYGRVFERKNEKIQRNMEISQKHENIQSSMQSYNIEGNDFYHVCNLQVFYCPAYGQFFYIL